MVRLRDIAAEAGVTVMTVSKALRDRRDVSEAMKVRIRRIADQMGYVPDVMAQSLRSRHTRVFGLVISAVTNPIFARILMALEEQAHELGYDLMLAHSLNQVEREQAVLRRFIARRVDGIFLAPVYRLDPTAAVYEELRRLNKPVVLLGHPAPFCEHFVGVETDDVTASATLTRHLLSLGHRRIAFFAGPLGTPSAEERLEGYKRALRDADLRPDDRLIFNAGSTIEEGEKAALQFLNEGVHATAIQAVNDLVAIGAGSVLLGQGLKIPRDYSLVGFGNVLLAEHFRVPLTTIRQPKLRLGVAAMDSMLRLLRGERPETKRLPAEIVVRESTAAPRPS